MRRCGARRFALGADHYSPVATLDLVARDVVECRRADRSSRTKIETRMMPRASHGVTDNKSFGKRTTVMRAARRHCKNVITPTHQEDRFSVGVTENRRALRYIGI